MAREESEQKRTSGGRKAKWTALDISSPACTEKEATNQEKPKTQPAYVCLKIFQRDYLGRTFADLFLVLVRWCAIRSPH